MTKLDLKAIFRILIFCCIAVFCKMANGQESVAIYGSLNKADSLYLVQTILSEQLSRVGFARIEQYDEKDFKGKGILLSASPARWLVYSKGNLSGIGAEGVFIKSWADAVVILSNSQMGVQNGIFTYLEHLGFRYYFPHPDWHIIPLKPRLFSAYSYRGAPSFDHRRIWYGYGTTGSKSADANYQFWFKANRLGGSMMAVVGHSYDDIVSRNKDAFLNHPDWLTPTPAKGVIPANPKFNLVNESLIKFVIADVLNRIEQSHLKNATLKMVTLSPSDGPGTCNTPACQALGTITDRVYSLINRVAAEVKRKYPGVWISGMAYSEYSEPPSKKLESNTFVSIATAFNYSKYTTDDLLRLWSSKAGKVGIYDYLGLLVWDWDMPGKGLAGQPDKAASYLKKYYQLGARGYDAESTPGSINKGLGHYMVARLLWNIQDDPNRIRSEFFTNCFGKAAGIMSSVWSEWENYPYTAVRQSDLANWIDKVDSAEAIEKSEAVKKRFSHIRQYLHYIYLYEQLRTTRNDDNLLKLLIFCYNSFDKAAISGYPALRELGNASRRQGYSTDDPNAKFKVADTTLNSCQGIGKLIAADRKTLVKKDIVVNYKLSKDFKKATVVPPVFNDNKYKLFRGTSMFNGPHAFLLKIEKQGNQNFIKLAGGFVTGGGSDKPIIVSVTRYTGTITPGGTPLLEYKYFGKTDTQQISLAKLPPGNYLAWVNDPQKYFRIDFSPPVLFGLIVTPEYRMSAYTRYMCFFVPEGTKKFRVFKDIETILVSPTGRVVDMSKKGTEEIDVDVKPGEQGLWMINFLSGKIHIEGIPPMLGLNPAQMLVPN